MYQGWWTPKNGETLQLVPEPENPKDKNAVSVVKNNRVVGHVPLRLANTTEGVGLLRHFLAKPGASGIVGRPVRSKNNAEVNRRRKRKTKDESNKDHRHLTRKKKKVELTRTKSDRMDNGTMRILYSIYDFRSYCFFKKNIVTVLWNLTACNFVRTFYCLQFSVIMFYVFI